MCYVTTDCATYAYDRLLERMLERVATVAVHMNSDTKSKQTKKQKRAH